MKTGIANASGAIVALVLGLTGAAALLLLSGEEGVPAAVTVLFLGGGGLGAILLTTRPEQRGTVAAIFGVGLALRAVIAALVYHWNPAFFSLDQGGYFPRGAALAAQWHDEGSWPSLVWLVSGPGNHFSEMWAVLSYFVGPSELALRIATSVVGAYAAVRVYALGREMFGERQGRWAGWLAACWPSSIIWSAQGLRDPLVIWLWCEAGLAVLRVCRGSAGRGLLGIALALYGLTLVRPYGAVLAGIGACFALLVATARGAKGAKLVAIGVTGLALLVGGLGFLGSGYLAGKDIETAASIHQSFQHGGSSFAIGADISTYAAATAYIPLGLAYFLLAPFPWQAGSMLQMSTMLEQPVWYAVFGFAVYGMFVALRRRGAEGLVAIAFVLPAALFYALVMSNVGTGYRDRAQLLPFVFIYAAQGLVAWGARRANRRIAIAAGVSDARAYSCSPLGPNL